MAAETPPTAAPAKDRTPTAYHVLRFIGGEPRSPSNPVKCEVVGQHITAPNSEAAIKAYAEKAGENANGRYVAVPSRSWRPTTVETQTTTTLKIAIA